MSKYMYTTFELRGEVSTFVKLAVMCVKIKNKPVPAIQVYIVKCWVVVMWDPSLSLFLSLDCHVHLNLGMRGVAVDFKVLKFEVVNVLKTVSVDDFQRWKGAWLTGKLTNENRVKWLRHYHDIVKDRILGQHALREHWSSHNCLRTK